LLGICPKDKKMGRNKMKILIVDDNENDRYLLETLLTGNGYEVVAATNGEQALAKLQSGGINLIISDILMPVTDGFQLCRKVKGNKALRGIPFIFYTATYTGPQDEEFSKKIGADRFIRKPCETNEFLEAVQNVMGKTVDGRITVGEKPTAEDEVEIYKLYSERLVRKLEQKMLALETEIHKRAAAEENLRNSHERLRRFIDANIVGVVIASPSGNVIEANDYYLRTIGYTREEFEQGMINWRAITPPEWLPADEHAIEELRERGICTPYEKEYVRRDRTRVSVYLADAMLPGLEEQIAAFVLDITERKQAEQQMLSLQAQLQQSQKMEAIGRLAGGVAHDFNNLLTVISVQSQLGLRGLREGDPLKEKLKDIEQAADRAGNLTRQLLAFSRRQILEMKVFNLNIILTDLEKMLIRVIGEDIALKTTLADELGMIKVDPGQMEQVIVNLAVNAKDAMPKGGKLLLETANAELDEEYTRSHVGMMPGAYVLLSITDTGVGMTEEVREQIFDPFFTTKGKGKGTGLGLSTVYGIVKQSGGDIYVYSEPGKGTTFKIYLPRVFEPPEKIRQVTREEIFLGKETLLVVEDEDAVRRLAVDILRRQGYTVLEAEAGGEALVICEQEKKPIHLILTDVIMPHMSGPELIERLRQVRKDFKVLYMTGYTDEAIVEHGILEEGIELIHKPFTIQKLSRKVREVLDKN
jgi:two-component system cell cycle sensor histidine kinase/response regulator CckA